MRDFTRYLAARFTATAGNGAVESLAPIVAALALQAGPTQVGLITATTLLVSIVLRIPTSMWADRQRSPVSRMLGLTLCSGVVTAVVPLLWLVGELTFPRFLLIVAASIVVQTLISSVGHNIVNDLVPSSERVVAVGKLNSSYNAANIVGHSGGAGLISIMAPPLTLLSQSLSAIVSGFLLRGVRRAERASAADARAARQSAEPDEPARPKVGTAAVFGVILRKPDLWLLWSAGVIGSLSEPVAVLFFLRELDIPAATVGLLTAMGAVGGIAGGYFTGVLNRRVRYGHTVCGAVAVMLVSVCFVPLLPPDSAVSYVGIVVFEGGTAFGGTVLLASVYGMLQAGTARPVISRTMSAAQFAMESTSLVGIGAGILLARLVAARSVFVVTTCVYALLGLAAVLLTALGLIRAVPRTPVDTEAAAS